MYEYKFVKVLTKGFTSVTPEAYKDLIKEYGEKGYRFVQIFPCKLTTNGCPLEYEIIFERKTE